MGKILFKYNLPETVKYFNTRVSSCAFEVWSMLKIDKQHSKFKYLTMTNKQHSKIKYLTMTNIQSCYAASSL